MPVNDPMIIPGLRVGEQVRNHVKDGRSEARQNVNAGGDATPREAATQRENQQSSQGFDL